MLNISSSGHIYFIYFSNIFSYENDFVKYLKTVVLLFQATLFSVLNKLFSNLSETGHSWQAFMSSESLKFMCNLSLFSFLYITFS